MVDPVDLRATCHCFTSFSQWPTLGNSTDIGLNEVECVTWYCNAA